MNDAAACLSWWTSMSDPAQRNIKYHARAETMEQAWAWYKRTRLEDAGDPASQGMEELLEEIIARLSTIEGMHVTLLDPSMDYADALKKLM